MSKARSSLGFALKQYFHLSLSMVFSSKHHKYSFTRLLHVNIFPSLNYGSNKSRVYYSPDLFWSRETKFFKMHLNHVKMKEKEDAIVPMDFIVYFNVHNINLCLIAFLRKNFRKSVVCVVLWDPIFLEKSAKNSIDFRKYFKK